MSARRKCEWHRENVPNRLNARLSRRKCIIDEILWIARAVDDTQRQFRAKYCFVRVWYLMMVLSTSYTCEIELDKCNLCSIPKLTLPSWTGNICASLWKMQFAGVCVCVFPSSFIYLLMFFIFFLFCFIVYRSLLSVQMELFYYLRKTESDKTFDLCDHCNSTQTHTHTRDACVLPISVNWNCIANIARHIFPS